MLDVIEAAERAVRSLRQWGVSDDAARQLVRVEVSRDTMIDLYDEQRRTFIFYNFHESVRERRVPMRCRGVSYYVVYSLEHRWRIISPGISTRGILDAIIVDAPPKAEPRDHEHEFDEASKQRG